MRLRRNWIGITRVCALVGTFGTLGLLVTTNRAGAEERKFVVMPVHSPKSFGGGLGAVGLPPAGLTNPADISRQYFDKFDPTLTSFAEFWEENSYGDITVTGRAFGWVTVPWAFQPNGPNAPGRPSPVIFDGSYGEAEEYCERLGAFADASVDLIPNACGSLIINDRGPGSVREAGLIDGVWTPGERFVDLDDDGRWDGIDGKNDQYCIGSNGCQSLCTYRICEDTLQFGCASGLDCLSGDCVRGGRCQDPFGNFDTSINGRNFGCLTDADCPNAGFPFCAFGGSEASCSSDGDCPDAPVESCGDPFGSGPRACDTVGCGDLGMPCIDFDFNLECENANDCVIPSQIIICTTDNDPICPTILTVDPVTGEQRNDPICLPALPGEPRFCQPATCVPQGPGGPVQLPECCDDPNTPDTPPGCLPNGVEGVECGEPIVCCEFDDFDGSGEVAVSEPFEDFMIRYDPLADDWVPVTAQYVRDNYPGDVDALIRRTGNGIYDAPDLFFDEFSSKLRQDEFDGPATPKPGLRYSHEEAWFDQWWSDTYGTTPPAWPGGAVFSPGSNSPNMVPLVDPAAGTADRIPVRPNRGGWSGSGIGTTVDPFRLFNGTGNIEQILPEERFGFFDGWVEHDDVASSKYHSAGDQRFGEITSPSVDVRGDGNPANSGVDFGRHSPNSVPGPDGYKVAAGPYAINIHGEKGYDAGDVAIVEWLTWRTDGTSLTPPNNWERTYGSHPIAGSGGFGFRDYNLDGLIDQGAVRPAFSENYFEDSDPATPNDGVGSNYPFNRQRLLEDVVEALDPSVDWDDFIDANTLTTVACSSSFRASPTFVSNPSNSTEIKTIPAEGIVSGVLMAPAGALADSDGPAFAPSFLGVHNEDNDDRSFMVPDWPSNGFDAADQHRSYNLKFSEFFTCEDCAENDPFAVALTAHEFGHAWQGWPDLYDYDVFQRPKVDEENCPIGEFDLMANGGLVHSVPVLKADRCAGWIETVDLTTQITPGVESIITFPPAELVRDGSYYYLENEKRPGERLWFWSAGRGIDDPVLGGLPGAGLVIMHTDDQANPEGLPLQQRTPPWSYEIIQADGLNQMEACETTLNRGDDGDVWPGSTGNTEFNFRTNPSATWNGESQWTGLDVSNIELDGDGSARVTLTWVPPTIPSLRFLNPPGGETVGSIYQVRVNATDVFGGTTIQVFATPRSEPSLSFGANGAKMIGEVRKTVPGTVDMSFDWNIAVPDRYADGSYYLFAKLIPGVGADGTEQSSTPARPGPGNKGDGTLNVLSVSIDDDLSHADDKARSESWTAKCVDAAGTSWSVVSTLSYPEDADDDPLSPTPELSARTNATFTSPEGEVSFRISSGTKSFTLGDTFTFSTTGYTAKSRGVEIKNGRISEGPTAVLDANKFTGPPPLEVEFDARRSTDPNNAPLNYTWDFGDGSPPVIGSQVTHRFETAGTFTVQLRATNPLTTRFDIAVQDVIVTNNSPQARIKATPDSGPPPLTVQFNAEDSSDKESAASNLIYEWDFGDGKTANDAGVPGVQITTEHFYSARADGTACTAANPCTFVATLTVTDENGATGQDTIEILVGNSRPTPIIDVDPVEGPAPLEVSFDASGSFDPEGDDLTIDWDFGDGNTTLNVDLSVAGNAVTSHKYTTPGTYTPSAVLTDENGASANWIGEEITVTVNRPPNAVMVATPKDGLQNVTTFTFDARQSRDPDSAIATYSWNFGDGSAVATGDVVTYKYTDANPSGFTVTLTVIDDRGAVGTDSEVIVVRPDPGNQAPVAHIATLPAACAAPCSLTFDGSLSFDPNGDELQYDWLIMDEEGNSDSVRGQSLLVRNFAILGNYSISLTVTEIGPDTDGLSDTAGPFNVLVVPAGTTLPPTEPPPTNPTPTEPPDSADQRPPTTGICGLGMVMSLFGSLFGLTAMAVARRRRFGM